MMTEEQIQKAIEDHDKRIKRYHDMLDSTSVPKDVKTKVLHRIEVERSARDAYSAVLWDGLPW